MSKYHLLSLAFLLSSAVFIEASEVFVTAERFKRPHSESLSAISVITAKEIESSQATTLDEILAQESGLQVSSNGAYGKQASIFLRGTDARHTLIIVDGVEYRDVTAIGNTPRLEFLTLENVEKIEILKGSQGVLYGSNAIGGVIKITTKAALEKSSKIDQGFFKLGYGSHDDRTIAASMIKSSKKFLYNFSGTMEEAQGISAYNEERTSFAENDSYRNLSSSFNIRYKQNKKSTFYFLANIQKAAFDYDQASSDDTVPFSNVETSMIGLKYDRQFIAGLVQSSFKISSSKTDRYEKFSSSLDENYQGVTNSFSNSNKLLINENHQIIGGIEYEKEIAKALGSPLAESVSNEVFEVFIQNTMKFGRLNTEIGARFSFLSHFEDEITYKVASSYQLTKKLYSRMSYNTGFKAPSLYQAHSSFGTLALKAERSQSYEVGLGTSSFVGTSEVSFFKIDYQDYIDFNLSSSKYNNLGSVEIKGIEYSSKFKATKNINLNLGVTSLSAKNKKTGAQLKKRPKVKYAMRSNLQLSKKSALNLGVVYVGSSVDNVGNLPSYLLIDTNVKYKVSDDSMLFFKIGNILDKKYEEVRNYGTLGRNYKISFKMKF